jgi:hypothetical protein
MDGVQIILELLTEDAAIEAMDPAVEITAGVLFAGAELPALVVSRISSNDRNIPAPGATRRVYDRVQVTALAADYPAVHDLLKAARRACADTIGTIAGASNVAVHTDSAGPDGFADEDASIRAASQDFLVSYNETR